MSLKKYSVSVVLKQSTIVTYTIEAENGLDARQIAKERCLSGDLKGATAYSQPNEVTLHRYKRIREE